MSTLSHISDSISEKMVQFDNKVTPYLSPLNNKYVSGALSLFLILYASLAAPKLPQRVAAMFDQTWFKIVIFVLIAYMANHNPSVAIIAAIAVWVSLTTASRWNMLNAVEQFAGAVPSPTLGTGCNCARGGCDCAAVNTPMSMQVVSNTMPAQEMMDPAMFDTNAGHLFDPSQVQATSRSWGSHDADPALPVGVFAANAFDERNETQSTISDSTQPLINMSMDQIRESFA